MRRFHHRIRRLVRARLAAAAVVGIVALGAALVGCGGAPVVFLAPASADERAPDAPRDGAPGHDGAFGVLLSSRTVRARGDAPLDVRVLAPTVDGEGVAPGAFAPVLLVHGGLVDVDRMLWLGAHIASRGFIVVAPSYALDLAIFSQGDGTDALAALRRANDDDTDVLHHHVASSPALAIGHSLGGVIATTNWLDEPGAISHLVLLASYPADNEAAAARHDGRVLSIAGGADIKAPLDKVVAGADAFTAPTTLAVVDGLTHYAWTDGSSDSERATDGSSDVPVQEQRRRGLTLVDAMLSDLAQAPGRDALGNVDLWDSGVHEVTR